MGTITKGILGGFNGKVGTVIGGTWKGIDYMRSRPPKRGNASATQAQKDQQARFGMAVEFVTALNFLIADSFKNFAKQATGQNEAVSYILKNAITGVSPTFNIDYSLALVSRGSLPNGKTPAATATGHVITFTWTDNSGIGSATATDNAILVCYCKDLRQSLYLPTGITRSAGTGALDVTEFAGKEVQTWLAFSKGEEYSNSAFTGVFSL
jgi:hypothetical protein